MIDQQGMVEPDPETKDIVLGYLKTHFWPRPRPEPVPGSGGPGLIRPIGGRANRLPSPQPLHIVADGERNIPVGAPGFKSEGALRLRWVRLRLFRHFAATRQAIRAAPASAPR